MGETNQEDKASSFHAFEEFRCSVDAFVNEAFAEERDAYHNDLESFEIHVERTSQEVKDNLEIFKDTFLEGYDLLFEELSHQYTGGPAFEQKLPPGAIRL